MSSRKVPEAKKPLDDRRRQYQAWHEILAMDIAELESENQAKIQLPKKPGDDAGEKELDEFERLLEEGFYLDKIKLFRRREAESRADTEKSRQELEASLGRQSVEPPPVSSNLSPVAADSDTGEEPTRIRRAENEFLSPREPRRTRRLPTLFVFLSGFMVSFAIAVITISVSAVVYNQSPSSVTDTELSEESFVDDDELKFGRRFKERRSQLRDEIDNNPYDGEKS